MLDLILPSADDVVKYAPPSEPDDGFLTENHKGLSVVTRPVGLREINGVKEFVRCHRETGMR